MTRYDAELRSIEDVLGPEGVQRFRDLDARRAGTAGLARENEAAAARLAQVPDGVLNEIADEAWVKEAERTMITDTERRQLLTLVAGGGRSARSLRGEVGISQTKITALMNKLRVDGLVTPPGRGKGAAYKITTAGSDWLQSHPL